MTSDNESLVNYNVFYIWENERILNLMYFIMGMNYERTEQQWYKSTSVQISWSPGAFVI